MRIQIKVIGLRGEEEIIGLCDTEEEMKATTVLQLKLKITAELNIEGDVRIVFGTETLEEDDFIVSYGIRHMSTVHILLKLPGGI